MELLSIGLGILTVMLYGSADVIAALATRRLRTFKATLISEAAGFLALFSCGAIIYMFLPLPLTLTTLAASMLIGIITGAFAAIGYFYLYRALEAGPIALVSPLTSINCVFTLLLSVFVLRQHLTIGQIGAVMTIILGVFLALINSQEIHALLRTPGYRLLSKGVRWALIAAVAFGVIDFGIGASATISGWFLPVLWTRIFSVCFLTMISYWKRAQREKRSQISSLTRPQAQEAETAELRAKAISGLANAPSSGNPGDIPAVDPDATVPLRSSGRWDSLASLDPEATVIRRPRRDPDTPAPVTKGSSPLKLLETSIEDTLALRSFRSYSRVLAHGDDANLRPQMEMHTPETFLSSQHTDPLSPPHEQETRIPDSPTRTLSLSLPSLEELSHLRRPLTSKLGMGILLAVLAGIAENAGMLIFSIDTQMATTGIAAVLASGYPLTVILFGISVYRERLSKNQIGGIIIFMSGLILLSLIK